MLAMEVLRSHRVLAERDTDVALAKLASIERRLERIRSVTRGDPDTIDDIDVEEIVVLRGPGAHRLSAHVIAGRC